MMGTMSSIKEIMQFCRLCLVKDQVNVSIFEEHGDTRDVKRKISECLPVTVSEEDSLPKKICDGCLYKLELLYQFRTTCVSAEKQLQVWIAELNNSESKEDQDLKLQHSQTSVKEEIFDATDHPDNSEYVIEEQHISYEEGDIPYNESQDDNDDGDATNSSDDEPLAKRRKRFLEEQVQTDDTLKTADNKMAITKLEHESDDENVDDPEPNFVSVGTSDDQQPGPSGLNKMSATTTNAEMPLTIKAKINNPKLVIPENMNQRFGSNKNYQIQITPKYNLKNQLANKLKKILNVANESSDEPFAILPDDLIKEDMQQEDIQQEDIQQEDIQQESFNREIENKKAQKYKCGICCITFVSPYEFSIHIQRHTGFDFRCPLCSYEAMKSISIRHHISRVHFPTQFEENAVSCNVCHVKFSSHRTLYQHQIRRHVPNIIVEVQPRYRCHFCKKIIKDNQAIQNSERPYYCASCRDNFNKKTFLDVHKTSHDYERPYVCRYCKSEFVNQLSLTKHLSICNK
nr:zinc finger protein ZFP69B-like isoform X12 [Onthophagus taurus]